MRITSASDSALCISFCDAISFDVHDRVISLFRALEQLRDPRIRNLHPAYASVLIDFDPLSLAHAELEDTVRAMLSAVSPNRSAEPRQLEIPVCYEAAFAPDLAGIAEQLSLTEEQIIALHSAGDYFVYCLGFAPGFAYLGGLASQLHVPRLATPRKHVAAGSVGLAGAQTGIYPNDSPGGWQLIGRTPVRMFDASTNPPSLAQPGDRVCFRRIDGNEFSRLYREQKFQR